MKNNSINFDIKLSHKSYLLARTESGFFEISEAEMLPNGVIPNAAKTPDTTVADLVAQAERQKQQQQQQQQQKSKRKASKIRRFQKEETV
jgi:hypothetical protein